LPLLRTVGGGTIPSLCQRARVRGDMSDCLETSFVDNITLSMWQSFGNVNLFFIF